MKYQISDDSNYSYFESEILKDKRCQVCNKTCKDGYTMGVHYVHKGSNVTKRSYRCLSR